MGGHLFITDPAGSSFALFHLKKQHVQTRAQAVAVANAEAVGCKYPGTGSISGVSDFSEPEGWADEGPRSRPQGEEHPAGRTAASESRCNHEKVARLRDQATINATRDELYRLGASGYWRAPATIPRQTSYTQTVLGLRREPSSAWVGLGRPSRIPVPLRQPVP